MDDKVRQYTEGDCWHLAMKISELTGWDVMEVAPDEFDQHVLVQLPDKQLLDVNGLHDGRDFGELIPFNPDLSFPGFTGCWRDNGYAFADTEHEVDYDARTLLEQEGLEKFIND